VDEYLNFLNQCLLSEKIEYTVADKKMSSKFPTVSSCVLADVPWTVESQTTSFNNCLPKALQPKQQAMNLMTGDSAYGLDSWYLYLKPLHTGHGYHVDPMDTVNVMLSDSVQEWNMIDCKHLPAIIAKCKAATKQPDDGLWAKGILNPDSDMLLSLDVPIFHGDFCYMYRKTKLSLQLCRKKEMLLSFHGIFFTRPGLVNVKIR
jgi:hypothetical protein